MFDDLKSEMKRPATMIASYGVSGETILRLG